MEITTIRNGDPELQGETEGIAFLTLISVISAMGGFLFGYETVVIAGTIAPVKAQFEFSSYAEGWFVSSGLVGCMVGVVVAGGLSDRIGRKGTMALSGLLLTIASVGCALSPGPAWLIMLRIIGGMGVGISSVVSPLYISEVSPPNLRGRFVSLFQLTITIGIVAAMLMNAWLLSYSLGTSAIRTTGLWHWLMVAEVWRGMFLLQAFPSILFLGCSMLVPDSPRWLIAAGKPARAMAILRRLRGDKSVAQREFDEIESAVGNEAGSLSELWMPGLRKPLLLGVFLAVFSELSGITVVMYYGPVILENAGLSASKSLGGHAVIGLVLATCTLIAVWLVDRVGRRRLLLIGVSGAFISLLCTGLFFSRGVTEGYRVVALLCAFVAFFAFSLGPVKWIVMSEIFPTRIRARAMSVATLMLWLTDVMINFSFPAIRDQFGVSAMFFLFSGFLLVQLVVVCWKMPETKGMTLEAINAMWRTSTAVAGAPGRQ